jgi:hypothetical protein
VVKYPDGTYHADTTPIIFDLEARHTARSVISDHPGIAFLARLIEDMADEFLPTPMFFYRWTDDALWCSRRQMVGWLGALDDVALDSSAERFLERQYAQLSRGGPRYHGSRIPIVSRPTRSIAQASAVPVWHAAVAGRVCSLRPTYRVRCRPHSLQHHEGQREQVVHIETL